MGAQWSQFYPPKPEFTEDDVESQDGKVFLITGGYSGIGFELAKMLYRKNGRVYIAGRSAADAEKAIEAIRGTTTSRRSLHFLYLELDDLRSIKTTVDKFRAKESKLHVLWNNAGVSRPPLGSVSKQGFELQLATHCLGPFLLTQLLLPLLNAASIESADHPGSVRVVWTSSQSVELMAPQGGLIMSELETLPKNTARLYNNSKAGSMFLASELARRMSSSPPIISLSLNPGAANTNLFRHTPWVWYLGRPLLYKPKLAALTQLYSGLSPDITIDSNGGYIIPWGRIATHLREDLRNAMRPVEEDGSGRAREFWDFCAEKAKDYQ